MRVGAPKLKNRAARIVAATMIIAIAGSAIASARGGATYRGSYHDTQSPGDHGKVKFTLAKHGRLIRGFKASPLAVCINPNQIGGIEVRENDFLIGKVHVRGNGRFHKSRTIKLRGGARQKFQISGRIRRGKVHGGRMKMKHYCSSKERFSAHRR